MATNLQLKFLSTGEVSTIYEKCVEYLSNKGIKVTNHPQTLKLLDKAGAQVNFNDEQVIFPRSIIEEALKTVPRNVKLACRNQREDLILPHPDGLFYTTSNTGAAHILPPGSTSYRRLQLADVEEWGQLAEALDGIDSCPFVNPEDVPVETADIHALKAILENTSKHCMVQPYSYDSIQYLIELAQVAAGNNGDLKKRPVISILACSIPPFVFDGMHVEIIVQAARYGIPLYADSLPSLGATSPITIPGTVLQCGIEILAMIVMSQILQPATPIMGRPFIFGLDMQSSRSLMASIENILCTAAAVQFVKEAFHIPAANMGFGTDSYIPDGEAMLDVLLRGILISLAGSTLQGAAGRMNATAAISPIQLLIDNKLAEVIRRIISGIKVDDDTLAWQEILDMEPGGHYLELSHTLRHCREALRTGLSVTQPRDTWLTDGGKDLHTRIKEECLELKKRLKPIDMPQDMAKELNKVVKQADEALAK